MHWWTPFFSALLLPVFAAPSFGADVNHGATIYAQICSQCHGPDPRQNDNQISNAANNPPLIEQQIATNPEMMFLSEVLSKTDIVDVAAYVNSVINPGSSPPALNTSPPWIMFPAQILNTSNPGLTLTLSNSGTSNLSLNSITLTPSDFGLLSGCGTVIVPNAFCQLTITFTPRSLGVINGSLSIATNAADSPRVLAVSGTAWDGSTATPAGTVVEFYNPDLDRYFITADPTEQAFVDTGAVGRWLRTRLTFKSGGLVMACRFFGNTAINPATGKMFGPNSHFYTAIQPECDGLKSMFTPNAPSWKFESLDFQATPVNGDGSCPTGTEAILRAYNNGNLRGVDSNHRITASAAAIAEVVAHGWTSEGVVMCAPQ